MSNKPQRQRITYHLGHLGGAALVVTLLMAGASIGYNLLQDLGFPDENAAAVVALACYLIGQHTERMRATAIAARRDKQD